MEKTIGAVLKDLNYPQHVKQVSEPDPEIELTGEEAAAALAEARQKKARVMDHQRREDIRRQMEAYYMSEWSIDQYIEFVRSRMVQTQFKVDANNRELVTALTHYFNNHPVFETYQLNNIEQPMDLKKGIFLFGTVGVGKTRIMELFKLNKRQCFQMVSCRKVVSEYVKHGSEVIEPFSKQSYPFIKNIENFWQESMGVCFDDLGTESDNANNYGNKRNVFEQIILDRYDNHLPFDQTHFTSNLSPAMIKERYGERVSSRMRECFNLIEFKGNDRRR